MPKLAFLVFTICLSVSAQAANVTEFSCRTDRIIEGKRPTRIEFQVKNLGKKIAEYAESDEEPVRMFPRNSVLMLNDNYGLVQKKDRLVLSADGDGCQLTELVLYKTSQYRKGYVRVKDTGCARLGDLYSNVSCDLR